MTLSKWDELEAQKSGGDDPGSDTTPVYDQPSSPKQDMSTKKYEGMKQTGFHASTLVGRN